MIRRPPRSTLSSSSAASDVYKRQHLAERFTLREAKCARRVLDGAPLGLLVQQTQLPSGPRAKVALEQSPIGDGSQTQGLGDRRGGLPRALERRDVQRDRSFRELGEAKGDRVGLGPSAIGEV